VTYDENPLTASQQFLINDFYSKELPKIALDKTKRDAIWHEYKEHRTLTLALSLEGSVPALYSELSKALLKDSNMQSAVLSECVYAQALADHFHLVMFEEVNQESSWLDTGMQDLLKSHGLKIRYLYKNISGTRILVQAGGFGGVDCALIYVPEKMFFNIEFKEAYAKTSEPDLPEYLEDGLLRSTEAFVESYPQFVSMLEEQMKLRLNFFEHIGNNINNFSSESIETAVSSNYAGKKFADVICTEDESGQLVMIPSNDVSLWARLEGEIRPAGRNHYKVWTADRLLAFIFASGGEVEAGVVRVPFEKLVIAHERGGKKISRYKINSLFFVRPADVKVSDDGARFELKKVRQLKPTITAKMNFKGLKGDEVRTYYRGLH